MSHTLSAHAAASDAEARAAALGYEAVQLFVERARARRPGYEPTAAEARAMMAALWR